MHKRMKTVRYYYYYCNKQKNGTGEMYKETPLKTIIFVKRGVTKNKTWKIMRFIRCVSYNFYLNLSRRFFFVLFANFNNNRRF